MLDPRDHEPLPVAERLNADGQYTGKGVTAAFLDSGFYAHPDLGTQPSRIRAYADLIHARQGVELLRDNADPSAWHGMMSTVVAAGDGALSKGRFVSLAPDLSLVLVKIGNMSRVRHDDLTRGIEWVVEHRAEHNIRVLNISAGGDYEASYLTDKMSQAAEAAVRAGIVVVAAVGNNGHRPGYVVPPASVPAVVSVGGLDDAGNPQLGRIGGYRSSFGPTIDGIQKPEIITLADWIAAPMVPGTPTQKQAALLSKLEGCPDEELSDVIALHPGVYAALDEARGQPAYFIRQIIAGALRDGLVIDEHYKMVDGTSFAAPIITSLVAQMLQCNPSLQPYEVKRILLATARKLPNIEWDRQGWGAVQGAAAVAAARDALAHPRGTGERIANAQK